MREQVVRFGDDGRLVGIISRDGDTAAAGQIGVLLLNSGIIHRIGPHRLNVKLARAFAGAGHPAIRFDLSGLGDSPSARGAVRFEEQAVADISAAIGILADTAGCDRVYVVGICSGADHAYRAALSDRRIAGVVLLDPYSYAYPLASAFRRIRNAGDGQRWVRAARKLEGRVLQQVLHRDERPAAELTEVVARSRDHQRSAPPLAEFGADLATLAARGCRIEIVYSGAVEDDINAAWQFHRLFRSFDFKGNLRVTVWSRIDHTYTELASQHQLKELLLELLELAKEGSSGATAGQRSSQYA